MWKYKDERILTTKTKRVLRKKRAYPNKFLNLVLIFASLYVSTAIVPRAKG
jgi:hypothetical protein